MSSRFSYYTNGISKSMDNGDYLSKVDDLYNERDRGLLIWYDHDNLLLSAPEIYECFNLCRTYADHAGYINDISVFVAILKIAGELHDIFYAKLAT